MRRSPSDRGVVAGFIMARADNQTGDRVGSGYTASGHYSGVPSPTAGAGFPVIALGIDHG
jgi:hypothetical protein